MIADDRARAVSALLTEAERAHGVYESTVLGGVYDKDWPAWYAAYAVEHGIGDLVGHAVGAAALGAFLASSFERFSAAVPKPTEGWADWIAGRLVAEL